MGDEFRREIAAAALPSTRVSKVAKSDCGIALVQKRRKAKVVSGPQTVWGRHLSYSVAPTRPRRGVFEFFAGNELSRVYRYVDEAGLWQVQDRLRSLQPAFGLYVEDIVWACDGVEGPPLGWCMWRARLQINAAEEAAVYESLHSLGFYPLYAVVCGRSDRKVWAQWMAAGGGVDVRGRPPVELLDLYRGEEGWQELVQKQVDKLRRRLWFRKLKKLKVRPWAAHGRSRSWHGDGGSGLEGEARPGYPRRRKSSSQETAGELREAGRDAEDWLHDGAAADMLGGPGGLGTGDSMGADGGAGVAGLVRPGVGDAGKAGADADGDGRSGEGGRDSDADDRCAEPAGTAADMLGGPGGLGTGAGVGVDGGAGVAGPRVGDAGKAGADGGGFGEGTRGSDAGDGSAETAGAAADRTGGSGGPAGTACFVRRMAAQAVYAGRAVRVAQTGIVGWARGLGEAARTIGSLILLGSLAALAGRSGAGVAAQAVHGRLVMRVARQPTTMRGGRMRGCCGKVASGERGLNVEEQEPAAAVVGRWRGMERSAGGGRAIGLRRGPHAGWVRGSARLRRPCGDRAITHCSVFRCQHR